MLDHSKRIRNCCRAFSQWSIFLLLICFVTVVRLSKGGHCRKIKFKEQMENKALRNHVIKSLQELDVDNCELQCYPEPNCVSYNYGPSLCELNDMTHLQAPLDDMEARDGSTYRAIFYNPCLNGPCLNGATCQTGFGSHGYRCVCVNGFQGDNCEMDVDECTSETHDCPANGVCTNMEGSFQCECQSGFTGDGKTCDDIDECTTQTHDCSANGVCTNAEGSFQCECQPGFTGDGKTCGDIDECTLQTDDCSANSVCTNVDGSFNCECLPGFTGDGETCNDIDECALQTDDCSPSVECTNLDGSFNCECQPGFTGDGKTCTDIDECTSEIHDCSANGVCNNVDGSFNCECRSGFSGDGETCSDIDECTSQTPYCSSKGECINMDGSYQCECQSGFTGDGKTCNDIDECTTQAHDCSSNGICTNVDGSFQCVCEPGFTGDGKTCSDINECTTLNHDCSPNGQCTNVDGTFLCNCNAGFTGDGKTCTFSCFLNAVGVADKDIVPNGKMTASSMYWEDSFAHYARLNGNKGYGWCSYECCENDEWLQVDIGRTVEICGIATQGSPRGQYWVEDFKFSYSTDGSSWTTYQDLEGTEMVFNRNGMGSGVDEHSLSLPVSARFVRFRPTDHYEWNCLRVEVYGISTPAS